MKFFFAFICLLISLVNSTPLDDYVKSPDPYYKYELLQSYKQEGCELFILNLTSQKWLDGNSYEYKKTLLSTFDRFANVRLQVLISNNDSVARKANF